MKTFNELKKDLEQIKTEASKITERYEKAMDQLRAGREHDDTNQSTLEELDAIIDARKENRLSFEIVKNNACIALYHEVMPIILDALKAYEGKTHGEKTAAKIREELKTKTKCFVYISDRGVNIIPMTADDSQSREFRITVGEKYDSKLEKQNSLLTPDNKIKVMPLESFFLYYNNTYIENVSEAIKELKILRAKAYQQQQVLGEICKKYNALAVGDIGRLRIDKAISDTF